MPSSRVFANPGNKPVSLMSPSLAGGIFTTSATWEANSSTHKTNKSYPKKPHTTERGSLQLEWGFATVQNI